MKKIRISYLNKNKFSNGLKFICIGAALSLILSGCSKNDLNNSSFDSNNSYVSESTSELSFDNLSIDNKEDLIDISSIFLNDKSVSVYNSDFKISEDLKIQINNHITNYGGNCSFIAINLTDGMSFGYNIDKAYPTASTIKAPFSLYCFKEMDKNNGSLDELKLYEERFRRDGSGVLQNEKSGTSYSLRNLFYYTINYSDNVAYYMVHDRFYNEGYNDFLKELGCNQLFLEDGAKWGYIDARSMALVWQEIYKYKDESSNGEYLFELLTNAQYNYIREGMEKYESAHKSGWTPRETHDSGIVFASDDYIVVILNDNNGNYPAKNQLLNISGCIEKVIDEYTLYKKDNKKLIKY